MAPTKQQNSRRYYQRKVERALRYLQLANDFERLHISSGAGGGEAPATTSSKPMKKVKAMEYNRCFGKVSNSTDLEGGVIQLIFKATYSNTYHLSSLTYPPSLTL